MLSARESHKPRLHLSRSKQPPSPSSPELAPAPPGDPAKRSALEKGRQLLRPTLDQVEQMRRAEPPQPQEFSIEVRKPHKAKAAAEAAGDQQPSTAESQPMDMIMPGSAVAEPLGPAASAETVVHSQTPRNEHQALRGAAAGQPVAGLSAPQPARCAAISQRMPSLELMLMRLIAVFESLTASGLRRTCDDQAASCRWVPVADLGSQGPEDGPMRIGAAAAPVEPPAMRAEQASTAARAAATVTAPQPLAQEEAQPIVPDSEVRSEARTRGHRLQCCLQQSTRPPLWAAVAD